MCLKNELGMYKFKAGKKVLEDKKIFDSIIFKLERLGSIKEGEEGYAKEFDKKDGWEIHYPLKELNLKPPLINKISNFKWHFDSYNKAHNVAIEFEKGPQTQARWDWVKFQLGKVDVGVLVIKEGSNATVNRCKNELDSGVFENITKIDVPMYIIQWPFK